MSYTKEVRFKSMSDFGWLTYLDPGLGGEEVTDHIDGDVWRALKGAEDGDLIELDCTREGIPYDARRISGTLEGRVRALEAALKAAGIEVAPL